MGRKKRCKRVDERATKRRGERMKTMSKKRKGQNEGGKKLMLLSHSCKEPPGVCIPGRAYYCCHEKTFSQKLQLKDYFKCSEEILQLLGTHHIQWINKHCKAFSL